jgi:hypothetical protein
MKEEEYIEAINGVLSAAGVGDQVTAGGTFSPRGHSEKRMLGGIIGSSAGDLLPGAVGEAVDAAGLLAGVKAGGSVAGSGQGLPEFVAVGVSPSHVYGFEVQKGMGTRVIGRMLFGIERSHLEYEVKRRVNVRLLILHSADGEQAIELEGAPGGGNAVKYVLQALADE